MKFAFGHDYALAAENHAIATQFHLNYAAARGGLIADQLALS